MKFESAKKMHIDWVNAGLREHSKQLIADASRITLRFQKSEQDGYKEVSKYAANVYVEAAELIERAILEVEE